MLFLKRHLRQVMGDVLSQYFPIAFEDIPLLGGGDNNEVFLRYIVGKNHLIAIE
jgi:hypothetical protein